MRTIGIIAEYNPFHSGHRHHIQQSASEFEAAQDCAAVCVMSGNWVQRGDAAIADKWTRARLALEGGADLVVELPTMWAVSSAETFAQGAVDLLHATGCVDILSFGSEVNDLSVLRQAADCIDSPEWRRLLRKEMRGGLSFPQARQRAAEQLMGEAACLKEPNNNLGVEYIRAVKKLGDPFLAYTLPRLGAGHDQQETEGAEFQSASALRQKILSGNGTPLLPYLSPLAEEILRENPASLEFCTRGILTKLRGMEREAFSQLPDSSEGLGNRLYQAVQDSRSLEELYAQVKTKRYTHARIRRMVLWAFLGLTEADRPKSPPYLRVLGFSSAGRSLLKQMKTSACLPVIVKPAHIDRLSPEARRVFALEARCTKLYELCRKSISQGASLNEYTQNPCRLL